MFGIYLIGGYNLLTDEISDVAYELDTRGSWIPFCNIPRSYTASCASIIHNNYLYTIAGQGVNGGEVAQTCDRLTLSSKSWDLNFANLKEPVFVNGVGTKGINKLILSVDIQNRLGSPEVHGSSSCIVEVNTDERSCSCGIISFPELQQVPVVSLDNKIFSCGGYGESGNASRNSYVVPDSDKPSLIPLSGCHLPRGSHCLVPSSDKKHVFALGGTWLSGGRHSFKSCEKYDLTTNKWTFIKSMTKPRRNFCAIFKDEQIFVFGGFDACGEGIMFDTEIFDTRSGLWRKGLDVPGVLWNYAVVG